MVHFYGVLLSSWCKKRVIYSEHDSTSKDSLIMHEKSNLNVPFVASSRLRMRHREQPWGVRTRVPQGLTHCSRWWCLRHWWERLRCCCCHWTRSGYAWSCDWFYAPGFYCGSLGSPGDTTLWLRPGCTQLCTHTAAYLQQNTVTVISVQQ